MRAADRQRLKQLVDQRKREVLKAAHLRLCCSGCGGHIDAYSAGCGPCRSRRNKRGRRARMARGRVTA